MPERILIVEDQTEVREALRDLFVAAGYEVSVAKDGYDAIEKAVSEDYDVITMDVRMPGLNGIRATDLLRERRPSIPVVIISGYLGDAFEYRKTLEGMGVRYFLEKPVSMAEAVKTVRRAIKEARGR
ncbi:response regulator [bacterium]|nr:response regulator [bacterium]